MKPWSHPLIVALSGLLLAGLGGCGRDGNEAGASRASAAAVIRMDGSSTVFPIAEAVAEEYQLSRRSPVRVTVGLSGTGGGFKKLCRGEIDVANASRPILESEMEACRQSGVTYLELPVAFDAITVAVNPANDWVESLTIEDLRIMWAPESQGKVLRWNQVRPEWPDAPLQLFGPGADSGTFDYFTEAVVRKAKASRGDFTASEDDNVLVQGVENNRTALGYFGYAYYAAHQQRMRAVPIVNSNGDAVRPSPETVANGTYEPLSRPLFIYVNAASVERPEVREFVEFYLDEGATLVGEVGYVPLPAHAYEMARERFADRTLGSVFGGVPEVGVTVEELLARESKL
ncbi:MAG: protein sphX [Proteobacteria bacterium]|nr:MAG: protein sphX [Pseudomonadota bacterium]